MGHLNIALAVIRPLLPTSTKYIAREAAIVSETLQASAAPWAWACAYRYFYPRFDAIVCQSIDMRDDFETNYSIPASKLTVINNPVDIDRITTLAESKLNRSSFGLDPGREGVVNLVAAGRLCEQKGFDLLIEAVALSALQRLE